MTNDSSSTPSITSFADMQLMKVLLVLLQSKGIRINEEALVQLTEKAKQYFHQLSNHLQEYTEIQRRKKPILSDVQLLFRLNELEIAPLYQESLNSKSINEKYRNQLNIINQPNDIRNQDRDDEDESRNDDNGTKNHLYDVESLPFFNNEQYDITELVHSKVGRPDYIPSYLPDLPPDYTYQNTPNYITTITDLKTLRVNLVEQSRSTEKSLYGLIDDEQRKWRAKFEQELEELSDVENIMSDYDVESPVHEVIEDGNGEIKEIEDGISLRKEDDEIINVDRAETSADVIKTAISQEVENQENVDTVEKSIDNNDEKIIANVQNQDEEQPKAEIDETMTESQIEKVSDLEPIRLETTVPDNQLQEQDKSVDVETEPKEKVGETSFQLDDQTAEEKVEEKVNGEVNSQTDEKMDIDVSSVVAEGEEKQVEVPEKSKPVDISELTEKNEQAKDEQVRDDQEKDEQAKDEQAKDEQGQSAQDSSIDNVEQKEREDVEVPSAIEKDNIIEDSTENVNQDKLNDIKPTDVDTGHSRNYKEFSSMVELNDETEAPNQTSKVEPKLETKEQVAPEIVDSGAVETSEKKDQPVDTEAKVTSSEQVEVAGQDRSGSITEIDPHDETQPRQQSVGPEKSFDIVAYAKLRRTINDRKIKQLSIKRRKRQNNIFMQAEKYYSPYCSLTLTEEIDNKFHNILEKSFKSCIKSIRVEEAYKQTRLQEIIDKKRDLADEAEIERKKSEFVFGYNPNNDGYSSDDDDNDGAFPDIVFSEKKEENANTQATPVPTSSHPVSDNIVITSMNNEPSNDQDMAIDDDADSDLDLQLENIMEEQSKQANEVPIPTPLDIQYPESDSDEDMQDI